MSIAAGLVVALDEKRRRRHDLLARLREVDHWRRLVAARLDLAIAAVTAIEEPGLAAIGDDAAWPLPHDLKKILGLPACEAALTEASVLLQLRAAQRELDDYADQLRATTDLATLELAGLLDAERSGRRPARRARGPRQAGAPAGTGARLHVVTDTEDVASHLTEGDDADTARPGPGGRANPGR